MNEEIQLGDKVRCKNTGFVGIAIAKTEYLNGCIQYDVVPKVDKDNKMPDPMSIDSQSLEVISTTKKKIIKTNTGGPMRRASVQRGY